MNFLYGTIAFVIFIAIIVAFFNFIYIENFTNGENNLYYKDVDENILYYSTPVEEGVDIHIYNRLLKVDNSFNSIKYIEGTSWEDWQINSSTQINKTQCDIINKKLMDMSVITNIIYFKLNKLCKCKYDKHLYLIDCDLVLFKKGACSAEHVKMLYVYNEVVHTIDIINCILVGKINENNAFMKNTGIDEKYQKVSSNDFKYTHDIIKIDDDTTSQDLEVQKLLYNKIMKTHEVIPEDLRKNIEYTNNQNEVRKMFINKMLNNNSQLINEKNKFRNYPHSDDFKYTH